MSPKKHGEFHFKENVALIIWTLCNSGIAKAIGHNRVAQLRYERKIARNYLALIAQKAVFRAILIKESKTLRSVPQKFCERKPYWQWNIFNDHLNNIYNLRQTN